MKLASHGPRGAHARWDRETGNLPLRSGFPEEMVPPEGFEPSTSRSGGARSNPLSYEGNEALV